MNGLIEDIKQGDRAAFRELFEDYYPILCVFAMKINEKEEKMKTDRITSPIRKQGFRAS